MQAAGARGRRPCRMYQFPLCRRVIHFTCTHTNEYRLSGSLRACNLLSLRSQHQHKCCNVHSQLCPRLLRAGRVSRIAHVDLQTENEPCASTKCILRKRTSRHRLHFEPSHIYCEGKAPRAHCDISTGSLVLRSQRTAYLCI